MSSAIPDKYLLGYALTDGSLNRADPDNVGVQMTLLLVDDIEFIHTSLLPFLHARFPFVDIVGEASSLKKAQEVVETTQLDVAILDIHLAEGGGFELLRQLKAQHRPPIVIVFTDLVAHDFHITCLEAGADFFFDKVCSVEVLHDVLWSLVQFSEKNHIRRKAISCQTHVQQWIH